MIWSSSINYLLKKYLKLSLTRFKSVFSLILNSSLKTKLVVRITLIHIGELCIQQYPGVITFVHICSNINSLYVWAHVYTFLLLFLSIQIWVDPIYAVKWVLIWSNCDSLSSKKIYMRMINLNSLERQDVKQTKKKVECEKRIFQKKERTKENQT